MKNISPTIFKFIEDNGEFLTYQSDGYSVIIKFLGITIWNCDDDPRPYDDDLEYKIGLENFIKSEIRRIVTVIIPLRIY
jgi:hypothetical protein